VPFLDAVRGTTIEVSIPRLAACADCGGSGTKPGATESVCADCGGSGRIERQRGALRMAVTCPRCGGRGRLRGAACGTCGGDGRSRQRERVRVRIPAGVEEGTTLRVAGRGDAGSGGAPAGDAYLVVRLEPDPVFRREGRDLVCDVEVGIATAALGGTARVPTPGGEATVEIPAGCPSGQRLRLRGRGIAYPDGRTGDLYAVIQIRPPKRLDKRSRQLLEEFRERNP